MLAKRVEIMDFNFILEKTVGIRDLQAEELEFAMQEIVNGRISDIKIAAFITALKTKGEKASEIAAIAEFMRKHSTKVKTNAKYLVDTAGTGGDNSKTFNVSTCAALVAAASGITVAKHGNRAISSNCGSADALEELGVGICTDAKTAEMQLNEINIAFLFAPAFHPTMKKVAAVRKELGFKSIFNLAGPLTNPANAKKQIIGVYDKEVQDKIAEALQILGTEKSIVANSNIDEISISEKTRILEISGNKIEEYFIEPEDFGFKKQNLGKILVENKTGSARMILEVLNGREGAARDITVLNAGAAIYASSFVNSIGKGISLAEKAIDSGKAFEKLEMLRNFNKQIVHTG